MQRFGLTKRQIAYGSVFGATIVGLLAGAGTLAQVVFSESERNVSRLANYQNECAIAVNPTDKNQLFASCNNATGGLFFARSTDRGTTWIYPDADRTIADGDAGQGNLACCDPTLAWDSFGNLFIAYLGSGGSVEIILSTDGGQTFTNLATFAGSNDQPTIVAANTTASGAPVAVWIVWNQGGSMRARGATVTGLGVASVAFGATQTIPGTSNCSFGDVAIAPSGVVVQVCETPTGGQGPSTLLVNIDADGLGPNNFGAAITATTTNVGGFDFIPAQNVRSVDAEAGLAFDRGVTSSTTGRLYLVYGEENVNESNDTDIRVRFSDDNGVTWSSPSIRVNDDATTRSQFLPKISANPLSGNIAICWHDARNSAGNNQSQQFCSLALPASSLAAAPTFFASLQVSAGTSAGTGSNPPAAGQADIQYGDYAGLDYFQGRFHPIWADQSNSTGDNPDGTNRWDAYSNRVGGGTAFNEGDPHIRTVDGISYDFQTAGEFVSLKGGDGFEVQTRQTAIATTFFPGANAHTGLATCVSVNSAVAARVGKSRVTFQPRLDGVPDPTAMELRVDGVLTALTDTGVAIQGGRVHRSAVGGMAIEFPNGATLAATPGFWASQGKWYMNVNVSGADAFQGVMGAIPRGGWLPTLPDGSSLGPKPASTAQRYNMLNVKFADAWRVTGKSSLFDYAQGQSTADFTLAGWPKNSPPCDVPQSKPAKPATLELAQRVCTPIIDKNRRANCIFDVVATGETGFAKTYQLTERLDRWGTTTSLAVNSKTDPKQRPGGFIAKVVSNQERTRIVPTGSVQFFLHGERYGEPVPLDRTGRALLSRPTFNWKNYRVWAQYVPGKASQFLGSTSREVAFPDRSSVEIMQTKPN